MTNSAGREIVKKKACRTEVLRSIAAPSRRCFELLQFQSPCLQEGTPQLDGLCWMQKHISDATM
jgi:hypothetical protein